jgi:ABC-type transport system substrate-binding protein
MKRFRGFLLGAFGGFLMVAVGAQASISTFTGAQDPSAIFSYLNTLITSLNNEVTGYLMFQNGGEPGEMQIVGSGTAFAVNGQVNTGLTAVGPQGSHTTVQEWLVVVDANGFVRFIPCF